MFQTPSVGRIVHYRETGPEDEPSAATIVRVHDAGPDGCVDLQVLHADATHALANGERLTSIQHVGDPTAPRYPSYDWPPRV